MKTYNCNTGVVMLGDRTVYAGETVKESEFADAENLAWHIENGSFSEAGDAIEESTEDGSDTKPEGKATDAGA